MNRIAVRFTLAMLAVMFITAIVEASLFSYSLYVAFTRLPKESQKILERIFPESYDPFKFTDNEVNVLILAQVGVLVIGVVVALLVARRISRPLMNVSQTAARVARGDLSARAPISRRRGGDETATLLRNFNAMADSLERLEGERRATSAAIAHELRTPLTILRGRLEAIRDEVIVLDHKEISNLLSQTEVLSRLVTDLRTLSLADAGQISLERHVVDLKPLVAQVVSSFEARAAGRGMKLEFVSDASRLEAPVDSSRIIQVIANLIENAIRYAPEGGFARIGLNTNLNDVIITVRDSGAGIEADQLERIFDRFHRTDASRSRFTGGSGLGLAIVRAMVELHGGRITARNHPEGGAEFEVRLPKTLEIAKTKPKKFWARSLNRALDRTTDRNAEPLALHAPHEPSRFDGAQIYEAGTISNLTYLFLSFPLGLSYFIALIIGLSLGFPLTLVFGIGIPFLIFTLWMGLQGAALERWLNDAMLGIPVPFITQSPSRLRFRDRLIAQLRDPYAWRALLYLILKFPFGLVALVLLVGLIVTAAFCVFMPIGYASGMFSEDLLALDFAFWSYKINSLQSSFVVALAGLVLGAISFPILNLLAHWWGRFARVMLSNTPELQSGPEFPNLERPLKARTE
jgi:two-component system, OmpR family, sensor histidine kinase BaeS